MRLTLRADEVVTLRAFININRIEFERWRPPLVMRTGMSSAMQSVKEIEGKEWEEK